MPSTVIKEWKYYEDTQALVITYNSGAVYKYLQVPPQVYEEFCGAFSKGIFLNRVIKPQYEFVRVG